MKAAVIALALVAGSAHIARADGWWEVACNSDGLEGDGGCTNPNNPSGCTCDTRKSTSKRAASVGTALAMFAFVGYRIGRKRRRK